MPIEQRRNRREVGEIIGEIWKTPMTTAPKDFDLNIVKILRAVVKDHVDGVDCLDTPEEVKEAFGVTDPFSDFSNLAHVLEKLVLRKGLGDVSESEKEVLSKAYDTIQCFNDSLFDLATKVHDDSKLRAFAREHAHHTPGLLETIGTRAEALERSRRERGRRLDEMDIGLKVQNLIVELCDRYQIPTKRNPAAHVR